MCSPDRSKVVFVIAILSIISSSGYGVILAMTWVFNLYLNARIEDDKLLPYSGFFLFMTVVMMSNPAVSPGFVFFTFVFLVFEAISAL